MKALELFVERVILASRWILVVFYLGLAAALAVYAVSFGVKFLKIAKTALTASEAEMILSMLSLIEDELRKHKLTWTKLTGQTQKRDDVIARFTSGEVPIFLISLKAGGVGLNLPQADTVIHYDPWWNPAAENQATDRAHRIGQTQSVWVIKLVAQGTIEERILALQERKAELARELYSGAAARKQPLFTQDDVQALLLPMN